MSTASPQATTRLRHFLYSGPLLTTTRPEAGLTRGVLRTTSLSQLAGQATTYAFSGVRRSEETRRSSLRRRPGLSAQDAKAAAETVMMQLQAATPRFFRTLWYDEAQEVFEQRALK